MTENKLSDKLFLLLSKVLKLDIKAEYSIPYESNKHRRLDFVHKILGQVHILELKTEKITKDIVVDAIFNKNYLQLGKKEFSLEVQNPSTDILFYFINKEGLTEEAKECLEQLNNVFYISIKDYVKEAIEYSLKYSKGNTPINILGSLVKDYLDFVEEDYLKELRQRYSLYDTYRTRGYR
jgi:hypothetical protein